MSEETKDFTVKDRRIFSEGGEVKGAEENKEEASKQEKASQQAAQETASDRASAAASQLPKINFATFVISLNASALVHLGIIDEPATGQKSKNLAMAKQTIDTLSMLEEKTQGNLTKEEEGILKNVLYDLRIIYVREKG